MIEIINVYPPATYIDIGDRVDNDPPVFEDINLYKVSNAYITFYGYVLYKFSVLKQGISIRHRDSVSLKNILSFLFKKKKIPLTTSALSIANSWYANYYHFTVECLPKLYLLREHIANATLVFPAQTNAFHKQWFDLLGIKKIQYVNENQIVSTPLALTTSFSSRDLNHHHLILPEFRNWVLQHIQNINSISYNKIFIGRKNPVHRRILNIEEVRTSLQKLGFVYIEMEDYAVEDQIKLFHNAEQIICVHGAALSNMCFSSSNTKVLDLIHEQFKQWCFLKMALILGINYSMLPCKGTTEDQLPFDMRNEDIIVDIDKLRINIEQWNR